VPLVEAPRTRDGQPHLPHLGQGEMLCHDRTLENRCMRCVEEQTLSSHQRAGGTCFSAAFVGQWHIVPTREQVCLVPSAFTMAENDESSGHVDDAIRTSLRSRHALVFGKGDPIADAKSTAGLVTGAE